MARRKSPQGAIPLHRIMALFASHNRSRNLSEKSVKFYNVRLEHFREFLAGELGREPDLSDFTSANFQLFILEKQSGGVYQDHPFHKPKQRRPSSAYIHGYFRTVKAFGAFLEAQEILPENPMKKLAMPKLEEKQLQPLTQEEEQHLLDCYSEASSATCRTKAILMLMLDAGLRKAEILSLKLKDVHLEDGFLLVRGKGSKERWVPFGHKTGWVVQRYVHSYRPDPFTPNVENLFLDPEGNPMTEAAMDDLFARIGRKTGIKRIHPHLLRHTFGIRSQEMNIPSLTLQRYMGHSDVRTTERYAHAAQSEKIKRGTGFFPPRPDASAEGEAEREREVRQEKAVGLPPSWSRPGRDVSIKFIPPARPFHLDQFTCSFSTTCLHS